MTKFGLARLVVLAAAVGGAFVLGRLSRPIESPVASLPSLAPAKARVSVAAPSDSIKPSRKDSEQLATSVSATRWSTAQWLRNVGMLATGTALVADRVGPQLIGFFDLTPAETATLNAAVARAAQRIAELSDLHASCKVDETKGRLVVDVPAFPDEGGRVYDELVGQFRSVLGPERFAYFNALFGESFDQNYDGFGTHRVRYEVELKPMAPSTGQPVHRIEGSFVAGDGSSGRSVSQLRFDQIAKFHPVLKRFLPPASAATAK